MGSKLYPEAAYVDAELLDAEQVVAVGDAGRDAVCVARPHGPRRGTAAEGRALLRDLEPVTVTDVVGGGGRGLGHVDGDGTLVVYRLVECEGECYQMSVVICLLKPDVVLSRKLPNRTTMPS